MENQMVDFAVLPQLRPASCGRAYQIVVCMMRHGHYHALGDRTFHLAKKLKARRISPEKHARLVEEEAGV